VADNQTFCICPAKDRAAVQRHAPLGGCLANAVTEVATIIEPSTANAV